MSEATKTITLSFKVPDDFDTPSEVLVTMKGALIYSAKLALDYGVFHPDTGEEDLLRILTLDPDCIRTGQRPKPRD